MNACRTNHDKMRPVSILCTSISCFGFRTLQKKISLVLTHGFLMVHHSHFFFSLANVAEKVHTVFVTYRVVVNLVLFFLVVWHLFSRARTFHEIDVSRQRVASAFFRLWLQPFLPRSSASNCWNPVVLCSVTLSRASDCVGSRGKFSYWTQLCVHHECRNA